MDKMIINKVNNNALFKDKTEGAKENGQTKIIIVRSKPEEERNDKIDQLAVSNISDEHLDPRAIKFLIEVVNTRTRLIEKIVRGEIKADD